MNDRIKNFSTQLSEAAPLAPELEGRVAPAPRSPITAVRVGIALATIAVLGVVGLVVSGDGADRTPVVPAGNQTEVASAGAIADAVSAALPEGFALQLVERVDRYTAHAVAANDRFDVLDIEIIAAGPPDAITDDTAVTVSVPFTSEPEGVLAGTGEIAVPNGNGEITVTTGFDAFGPDEANIPSPFTASSASTDRIFVGIAMYSINAVATEGVAPAILGNLGDIANLEAAIMSLPEALAASDLFIPEVPLEGAYTQRGVVIGSLSVSLSTGIEDGTTLVQVSFPGNLEGSGNDGTVYWHATTIDGRVFIALLNADATAIWGSDRASFVQKIAEAQAAPDAVLVDDGSTTQDTTPPSTALPPETTTTAT